MSNDCKDKPHGGKRLFYCQLLWILLVLAHYSVGAEEQLTVIKIEVSFWTSSQNNQPGDKILLDFANHHPGLIAIKSFPSARGIGNIANSVYPCIFAGDEKLFEQYTGKKPISSNSISKVYWRYITASDVPVISNNTQLKGRRIALLNGIRLNEDAVGINPDIFEKIDYITEQRNIIYMVAAHRLDVGLVAMEVDETHDGVHYDRNFWANYVERKLNCDPGYPGSKSLIDTFNQYLKLREFDKKDP